jgi:hypothetical protein
VLDGSPIDLVLLNWFLLNAFLCTGVSLMAINADPTFGVVILACIFVPLLIATFGKLRYNAVFNGFRVQVLTVLIMVFATIWQCNFARPLPPQTSFNLGTFDNALLIGFSSMGLHLYEFHWLAMLVFASGKMISSVVAPAWGIGNRNEAVLIGTCTLIGHACGYGIALSNKRLREEQASLVAMAAANRRADSRLNHVIKGLCGGANGLLDGLWLMAQEEGLTPSGDSQQLFTQVHASRVYPALSPGHSASSKAPRIACTAFASGAWILSRHPSQPSALPTRLACLSAAGAVDARRRSGVVPPAGGVCANRMWQVRTPPPLNVPDA